MIILNTVPSFVFPQGDVFAGDNEVEYHIEVCYYNGCISLDQNGNSVNIHPKFLRALFREIKKHLPEALASLNKEGGV